ncbi:uncharacterized protein LOC144469551 [Augochlora pura]
MSEILAVKHKNSLNLTEQKLLQEKRDTNYYGCISPCRLIIFCIVMLSIFVVYWFVLGPILIHTILKDKMHDKYSKLMFVAYWVAAFFIWLFITLAIAIIWKCIEMKRNEKSELQSYGTSNSDIPLPIICRKDDTTRSIVKFTDTKGDRPESKLIPDKDKMKREADETDKYNSLEMRRNKSKKHKDLPPLMIHRRNSGNNIENPGNVNLTSDTDETDEDALKSGKIMPKIQRQSMQDYLKLVTVTPEGEMDSPKSPKGPLSPRDLFFIDLIKAAEEADKNKENDSAKETDGKHFFPNNFSPTEKDVGIDTPNENEAPDNPSSNIDAEPTYFIANIESPKCEKTEVHIDLDPEPEIVAPHLVNLLIRDSVITIEEPINNESEKDEKDEKNEKKVVFKE